MRKLALIITSVILLLSTVSSVAAKDATASPFRVQKEEARARKNTALANAAEKRKANIAKYLKNMVARLRAYVIRIEKLIARIESRLTKIAAEDPTKDLSKIKTDVEKAKSILTKTKDKITDLEGMETEILASTTPKETFKKVKAKVAAIRKDLKDVHLLLVHVIGDIKGLRVGESKNAK